MVRPNPAPSSVHPEATPNEIRAAGHRSGHLRLLVRGDAGVEGVVHVRDSLHAPPTYTARALMRAVLTLPAVVPVYEHWPPCARAVAIWCSSWATTAR